MSIHRISHYRLDLLIIEQPIHYKAFNLLINYMLYRQVFSEYPIIEKLS